MFYANMTSRGINYSLFIDCCRKNSWALHHHQAVATLLCYLRNYVKENVIDYYMNIFRAVCMKVKL